MKAIILYVTTMFTAIGGYALVAGIPFDMALRIALLVELCIGAGIGFVALLRHTSRHPKRKAPPPPVERATAEVVTHPQPSPTRKQIEAPKGVTVT